MTIATGTRLGRYEIRSQIGAGGMGEVYLGWDSQLRRPVALKLLPAKFGRSTERLRRFEQEAYAVAALNHPNIAHIYEIGEADGHHFIAMEYVDGDTLREEIHRRGTPLLKLLRYLQQVAGGLAKAHAAGIVHRDLKPDNIMITRDGYAKILDFGLAKLIEPRQQPSPTRDGGASEMATAILQQHSTPGLVLGTIGYMSPEQAQGRTDQIDHRSDIFSFGCILFEAVTGHRAFSGTDAVDTLNKIIREPPPPLGELRPGGVPEQLQRIVRRCLAKDPERRYQSIKDVAIELEELQQELKNEVEPERFVQPAAGVGSATSVGTRADARNDRQSAASTAGTEGARPTSSAEYIFTEIKRHKKGFVLVAAVLAVALASIAYGLYRFVGRKSAANRLSMKITRLTNSGKVAAASISPDGKYVAYSAFDESGQSSLWVRHVATTSNVRIVPPAGIDVTFGGTTFTPDGNYIYYIRTERSAPGVLYQVPVLGGTSKKLLENVSGPIGVSPDGKQFTFIRRYASQGEDALMVANADGTGEQKLAARKFPDFFLLAGAAWSPDGKTIACPVGGFTGGYYRSVAAIEVANGTQKLLTSHRWINLERVAWLADGSGVITTAQEQRGGPYQIWQISYPDGDVHTITNDLNTYHNVSLTADSSLLVAVLSDLTSNIWVAPAGDWAGARQITTGKENGGVSRGTAWAPDGRIVYRSRAGGNPDLWIMDADGRNQKQLTDDTIYEESPYVTPDNRHVVFASFRSGKTQIWRIDIDGSNLKQLTAGHGFMPYCSPDGKWVVYTSFGATGFNIWKVSIDGGEPMLITDKYALHPAVSPDGKLIACYYLDEQTRATKLALLPFEGGGPVKLFDLPQNANRGHPPRWTPDGRAVTYINTRGIVSNIWIQPTDGGQPTPLTDFRTDQIFSFDWSHDGRRLAVARGVVNSDVVLISNFR